MAKRFLRLTKAPIREALIDFRATSEVPPTPDSFASYSRMLGGEFEEQKPIWSSQWKVELQSSGIEMEKPVSEIIGARLSSKTGNIVIQVQSNGVSTSVLQPYQNWEHLLSMFKRAWEAYREVFRPISVTRIASRYINEFLVPRQSSQIGDWLRAPPRLPSAIGFDVQSEFSRHELVDLPTECTVLLSRAISLQGGNWSVILDIDAIRQRELAPNDEAIWKSLDGLRDLKNRAFFGLLTKQAVDHFK